MSAWMIAVIIGVTEHGRKELVAVEDGYRESEANWSELLLGLRERGKRLPVPSPDCWD